MKRQAQVVAAILNNFSAVESSLETMKNSAGSAMNEMGIIQDSLSYKLNALKETGVGIFQNIFDSDAMGVAIDSVKLLLELIEKLTSVAPGLTIAGGAGLALFIKNFD